MLDTAPYHIAFSLEEGREEEEEDEGREEEEEGGGRGERREGIGINFWCPKYSCLNEDAVYIL